MFGRRVLPALISTLALTAAAREAAAASVTQNTDPITVSAAGSVSCSAGGLHADNAYLRVYDLDGIAPSVIINSVQFGVQNASGVGGVQPIVVRIYELPPATAFTYANLTLIAAVPTTVPNQTQSLFTVTIPGDVTVDTANLTVIEVFTPSGQAVGNSFFIGSNAAGQSAPSYLAASACGLTNPTATSAIGFPNMHIVETIDVEPALGCLGGAPNGTVDLGEECDDNDLIEGDECDSNCSTPRCGNLITAGTETCDEGGDTADCDDDCTAVACGDGNHNTAVEPCDGGGVDTATCDANCTVPECGDGDPNLPAGEQCDDGNSVNSDACRNTCLNGICGDGVLRDDGASTEQCDDGNSESGDDCSATCELDTDGDTIEDSYEGHRGDSDGDGEPDYQDLDSDNDNIADADEAGDNNGITVPVDTDDDGEPDHLDSDSDSDGVRDIDEAGDEDLETPPIDSDNDTIPNFREADSDGDGVDDPDDICPLDDDAGQTDSNDDGIGDACSEDTDGDGVNAMDNCPAEANPDQADDDGDGIGDECEREQLTPSCSATGGTPLTLLLVLGAALLMMIPRRRRALRA